METVAVLEVELVAVKVVALGLEAVLVVAREGASVLA